MSKPETIEAEKRASGSLERMVRRHRKFWMETPAGNDVHILGDPRMPAATKRALGEMMDAAVKAYNDGKLTMPPNVPVSDGANHK